MTIVLTLRHLGPGPHPSGSPQSVHGSGEAAAHENAVAYTENDIEDKAGFTEYLIRDGLKPEVALEVVSALEECIKECRVRPLRGLMVRTSEQMGRAVADNASKPSTGSTTIRLASDRVNDRTRNYDFSVLKWQRGQKERQEEIARYYDWAEENEYEGQKPEAIRLMETESEMEGRFSRWGVAYKDMGIKTVIFHEYGHYILNLAEAQALHEGVISKYGAIGGPVDRAWDTRNKMHVDDTLFKVSKYASMDHEEWFAECFSMYMAGKERDQLPDYTIKFIKDIIAEARKNNLGEGAA